MGLLDCLATTDALAAIFSDESVVGAMLEFEGAIARGAAAAGVIPASAAQVISDAARQGGVDPASIAGAARAGATPAIPLVKALRERVHAIDPASAAYVHWGATSQDVTDTALILLLRQARGGIAADHRRLAGALRELSERHASDVMLGRTLLQPATPITFGLKTAGWLSAIAGSWRRLDQAWDATMVVQFGGAAGTLAALGADGPRVVAATARELELRDAPPWHTDRDRLGALMTACGLYVAALGKTARDLSLLMQAEVGEVAEPGGGSSTMPQKRNPVLSVLVRSAALQAPHLGASLHTSAALAVDERPDGAWHAEWPVLRRLLLLSAGAAALAAELLSGLEVHADVMTARVQQAGPLLLAERLEAELPGRLGGPDAAARVKELLARAGGAADPRAALRDGIPVDAVADDELDAMLDPQGYLGVADAVVDRALDRAARLEATAGRGGHHG